MLTNPGVPSRASTRPLAAALVWLALVAAVAVHQFMFWRAGTLDTDVLALLPEDERAPIVGAATQRLADAASRRAVVLLGAADDSAARRAAQAWRATWPQDLGWREELADAAAFEQALAFYRPWRDRLLTPEQRTALQTLRPEAATQTALAALHTPGVQARLGDFASDPLQLWPAWWRERAGETRARPLDGAWVLQADGRHWIVLLYDTGHPALALDGDAKAGDALAAARAAAIKAVPDVQVLAAGVPLHAEAAAVQASHEVNTIGWGSLAAILLLMALAFRRARPLFLVALSLLVGCAVALSVTAWVFGSVHLLTLVFGASLVGVAEDYGIHYYARRQALQGAAPLQVMHDVLPGLWIALATSVLGYAVLGLAPFPGLRQMALFSAVGLAAAFVTVWLWLPLLDRGEVPRTRWADRVGGSLERWPLLRATPRTTLLVLVLAALTGAGLWMLRSSDDLRQLQSSPPELVRQQREVGRLLGTPSPLQFFLVTAGDEEQLLRREEALTARLTALAQNGALTGYRALSDWLPSAARQTADAALTARAETAALQGVNAALDEALQRPAYAAAPLTLKEWAAQPAAAAARDLWLGQLSPGTVASVVMLRGLHDAAQLPRVAAAAEGLPGVRWVDRTAELSALLGRYRVTMGGLLLLSHAVVLLALIWRHGRAAWRAWVPTVLASAGALALLGALGQPLQLFNMLALALLLGVGVDYGIFLLEHPDDASAWLAVVLGATSTALAFGLLALSRTPALRAFGLTLLFGLLLVTLIAPCLRARGSPHPASSTA